jgi:hypothetical protein
VYSPSQLPQRPVLSGRRRDLFLILCSFWTPPPSPFNIEMERVHLYTVCLSSEGEVFILLEGNDGPDNDDGGLCHEMSEGKEAWVLAMICTLMLFFSFFFCGGGLLGFEVRAYVLAEQVLYHLSHVTRPFCFSYFSDRVLFYLFINFCHDPPAELRLEVGTTEFISLSWSLATFLPRLVLNHDPFDLYLK